MKIGVSGSHGTGKSFLVYELANKYKLEYPNKEVTVITEVARKCPFEINENASIEAQQWMLHEQIRLEIEGEKNCDIVITDRTVADYMAYAKRTFIGLYETLTPYLKFYIQSYDYIIFKNLENNCYLVNDGIRATDPNFQKEIDNILKDIYKEFKHDIKCLEII